MTFPGITPENRETYRDGAVGTQWSIERPDTLRATAFNRDTREWTVIDLDFPVAHLTKRRRPRLENALFAAWCDKGLLGLAQFVGAQSVHVTVREIVR